MPKAQPNYNYTPSAATIARNQSLAPPPPPTSSPWNGAQTLRRTAMANNASQASNNSSQGPQAPGACGYRIRGAPQLGQSQMNVSGSSLTGPAPPPVLNTPVPQYGPQGQQYMNPSVAPSASMISMAPTSVAGSTYSTTTRPRRRRPTKTITNVCERSNYLPEDYRLGEIYWVPYHEPNQDPGLQPTDPNLKQTMAGFVYTKRRMVIVMWTHAEDLFCVPMYTFQGKGLGNRPRKQIPEYVCVTNDDDVDYIKQGIHDPLMVSRKPGRKPFHPEAVVHITGGCKLRCSVDNSYCGRLTEDSYVYLRDLLETAIDDTKNQRF